MAKKPIKNTELNDRQMKFIEEYLIDLNGTRAAIAAGYSVDNAKVLSSQNLAKPAIQAEIARRRQIIAESIEVSKEQIIADLLAIKDLCFTDTRAVGNSIKALELVSKMLGYFEAKKVDVTTNGESINQITWVEQKTYDKPEE